MILAALLLAVIHHSDVVRDECDVLELNHFYDGNGKRCFSQWCFWDWNSLRSRHDVVAWAMASQHGKAEPDEKLRAMVAPTKEGWRLRFGHAGVEREISARQFRETHTQFDPELEARNILPVERRRGLSKPLRVPVIQAGQNANFIR